MTYDVNGKYFNDDGRIYRDDAGFMRVHSHRWGCNLFATVEDAQADAKRFLKHGRFLRLWRTEDGLYDWSSMDGQPRTPHLLTAIEVAPDGGDEQ